MHLKKIVPFLVLLAVLRAATAQTPSTESATPTKEPLPEQPSPTPADSNISTQPKESAKEDSIALPTENTGIDPLQNAPDFGAASQDKDFLGTDQFIPTEKSAPIDARATKADGEEQNRKLKIRYKEVRTKAEEDPAIAGLLEKAKTAKTSEGERAAYREFYRMLFKKMRKIDPSLNEKCDLMESAYLARLDQIRIEPTIPLEPPPKPQPLAK